MFIIHLRAPTPFPKEMRAMAKKVANMKERKAAEEERNNKRRNTRETVRSRAGANKNRSAHSYLLGALFTLTSWDPFVSDYQEISMLVKIIIIFQGSRY